jgi:hypothetical protein
LFFQNRLPGKIFGTKRDEIIGGWKKCIMWSQLYKSMRMRFTGHGREEGCIRSLDGKIRRK